MIYEIIENKLNTYPCGFGVDEVKEWLEDIPDIYIFSVFEPFFERDDLSSGMWFALMIIIRNKYIDIFIPVQYNEVINKTFNKHDSLRLEDVKNLILDFSKLDRLKKISLYCSKKCETVIFPEHSDIEFLEIINYQKISTLKNTHSLEELKFLAIRKCNNLHDFSFISNLKKMLVLDISHNKNIGSISFLKGAESLRVLQLIDTSVIKQEDTICNLRQLQKLKCLDIKATQSELKYLRKKLPYCIINSCKPMITE